MDGPHPETSLLILKLPYLKGSLIEQLSGLYIRCPKSHKTPPEINR